MILHTVHSSRCMSAMRSAAMLCISKLAKVMFLSCRMASRHSAPFCLWISSWNTTSHGNGRFECFLIVTSYYSSFLEAENITRIFVSLAVGESSVCYSPQYGTARWRNGGRKKKHQQRLSYQQVSLAKHFHFYASGMYHWWRWSFTVTS